MKNNSPQVITDNTTLFEQYDDLTDGDIVCERIRLKPAEETLLLDLVTRGIHLIPSALSQLASRSKVFQAKILMPYMVSHTVCVYDLHSLTDAINLYGKNSVQEVITKHDRRNAGMGVHLWSSIEEVYNHASLKTLLFPFVLQPFQPNCRDIRVIIIDDYVEAYWRHNPNSFRNNLHCGGESKPCQLTKEQENLCHKAMQRGQFPYAHIDILVTEDNTSYLGEINLRGGLKGAAIDTTDYMERIAAVDSSLLQKILATK